MLPSEREPGATQQQSQSNRSVEQQPRAERARPEQRLLQWVVQCEAAVTYVEVLRPHRHGAAPSSPAREGRHVRSREDHRSRRSNADVPRDPRRCDGPPTRARDDKQNDRGAVKLGTVGQEQPAGEQAAEYRKPRAGSSEVLERDCPEA